jgi:transcriptional regulator with XRE-family HTH domain
LKRLIAERNLSHRRFAQALGVSKQSVTNWTQGRSEPNLRYLRTIARILEVPLASLLEEPGERGSESPSAASDGATESDAVGLLRELTADPAGPAVRTLAAAAPDLWDLLRRAEVCVGEFDRNRSDVGN